MDTIGQPGPVGLEEHRPVSPAVNNDNRARTTSEGDHEFEILHEGEVRQFFINLFLTWASTECPKKIVPRLCGCCEGAVDSVISLFIQLHRSSFNLEFETLFESI